MQWLRWIQDKNVHVHTFEASAWLPRCDSGCRKAGGEERHLTHEFVFSLLVFILVVQRNGMCMCAFTPVPCLTAASTNWAPGEITELVQWCFLWPVQLPCFPWCVPSKLSTGSKRVLCGWPAKAVGVHFYSIPTWDGHSSGFKLRPGT